MSGWLLRHDRFACYGRPLPVAPRGGHGRASTPRTSRFTEFGGAKPGKFVYLAAKIRETSG